MVIKPTMPYYKQIIEHIGYFAVCGAKGCVRACMDFQEKTKNIEQCNFKTSVFSKNQWKLNPPSEDESNGIANWKNPEKYSEPDSNPGAW